MKYSNFTKILFSLTSLLFVSGYLHAETKIGIVDMNRIFSEYDKTKKTQAEYDILEKNINKELDARIEKLKKQVEAIDKITIDMEKSDLKKEERDAKQQERETKITEAKKLDKETSEFRSSNEKKFQEEYSKKRKMIIDNIMTIVNEQTKIRGFDLLLDKSGLSAGAIPVVLYSRPDLDISSEIITILNKKTSDK